MKKRRLFRTIAAVVLMAAMLVSGCGNTAVDSNSASENQSGSSSAESGDATEKSKSDQAVDAPELPGLTFESAMDIVYAEMFRVYNYEGGYSLIDVTDGDQYLVVPEDGTVPEGLDEKIIVLQRPLKNIYLAATSAMALFNAMDALDSIRLSGTQASGWSIENAANAMNEGKILFAGKYNEPDYELMLDENCDLAIESTMIFHSPKVKEMIEDLDIPVFIDRSSYETHPLGRTEWIKAYAVLVDKVDEATAFFNDQTKVISDLKDFKNTGKTVVFFYMNTDGSAVVRRPDDYIPKMIEIAGGKYAFEDLETDTSSVSVDLSMEEFYATAVDADYLIYNGAITETITSLDDLYAKDELFREFKAVKEGNVWATGKSLYQATDIVGHLITDINRMLIDGDESEMTFLQRVK